MRDSSVLLIAVTSLVINNHCCLLSCTNLQHCQPLNVLLSDQTVKIILMLITIYCFINYHTIMAELQFLSETTITDLTLDLTC